MDQSRQSAMLAGPGIMLISAAIFGYFGFTTTFVYHSAATGQLLIYVPMLDWTLKVTAVAFLVCGLVTFKAPVIGNLAYGVFGVCSAIMFVIVAVLDFADQKHTVMHPLLLLVFAAWNGYGSWTALRELMAARRAAPRDAETTDPPEQPPA